MPQMKQLRWKRDFKLKQSLLICPKRTLTLIHYWLLMLLYLGAVEDFSQSVRSVVKVALLA